VVPSQPFAFSDFYVVRRNSPAMFGCLNIATTLKIRPQLVSVRSMNSSAGARTSLPGSRSNTARALPTAVSTGRPRSRFSSASPRQSCNASGRLPLPARLLRRCKLKQRQYPRRGRRVALRQFGGLHSPVGNPGRPRARRRHHPERRCTRPVGPLRRNSLGATRMNAIDLSGQKAVVTGGANGIGYAVAERR